MSQYIDYEIYLQNKLESLKKTNAPIVIFGTMAMGQIALRTISFFNKKVICFCDNNKNKQGTNVNDIPVLSPERVKEMYPNAQIYICSFNENTIKQIDVQLRSLGFEDINDTEMILWVYQVYVIKRPISAQNLANTIYNLKYPEVNTVLKNVIVYITEKCTLRCKDCSAFVQYVKSPKHYDKNIVIKSMRELSESVDAIEVMSILGGEPLLHNDIAEICEEASKLKNVAKVRLVTNGTIVPSNETMKSFFNSVFYVSISNYGELSIKKDILKKQLDEIGVFCELDNDNLKWYEIFVPKKHNRLYDENKKLFNTCLWREQSIILQNGEFHVCGYSCNGKALNFFKVPDEEYINLAKCELPILEKRKVVKKLLNETECLSACDYCDIHHAMTIPAPRAVQSSKILTLE